MNNKIKIVIIGGGFGGVYSAKYLNKIYDCENAEVTLINKNNYFLFTPLLHEVATGGLTPDSIVEPIREVFRNGCINFVEDTVLEINKDNKTVKTNLNIYNYDYLIISPGSETNYFNIAGVKEYSFTLKSLNDAIALRNHIIETCENAVKTKNKDLLTLAVIGGGATGIELVAEIKEYMEHTIFSYYKDSGFTDEDVNVYLISSTSDILSQFPEKMRHLALKRLEKMGIKVMLNTCVKNVNSHHLVFSDNTDLHIHTIVWVAGIKSNVNDILGIQIGNKGRIDTNEYLQNIDHNEIYSLGDASGTFPALAQVAVQQAKTIAYNISASIKNEKLKKFTFKQKGLLISIGQWYAIGDFNGITVNGRFMWWIWRTIYLFNFISFRKKFEIMMEWTINLFYPRDITQVK